jgi:predicted dehydrogenase
MGTPLRVGIIGAGWAGTGHAVAYARLPEVVVAGIWSRTQARAEALRDQIDAPGTQVYTRWEDLINEGEIDALSIAAPPVLRRGPLEAALERNIHVLIEKPFTTHLPEARDLACLARDSSTVTAVCFNWRYSPGNLVARRAVQEGAIGKITRISVAARMRFTGEMDPAALPEWMKYTDAGGGTIRQFGSHEIDRVPYLTGLDFLSVTGRLPAWSAPGTNIDSQYVLLAELSDGSLADVASTMTPGEGEWRAILFGEAGTLRATHEEVVLQRRADNEPIVMPIPEADRVPDGVDLLQHSWNRLIADFCTAIREGDVPHESVPHLPSFEDGLRVQEFIAAAELAERDRRWVDLSEVAS